MQKILSIVGFLIISTLFISCGDNEEQANKNVNTGQNEAVVEKQRAVAVEEKMDAGEYSYLKVNESGNSYWIAVPKMDVAKGEMLLFSKSMEMKDFHSETLNRTFESVLFVDDAKKMGEGMKNGGSPHSNVASQKVTDIKVTPLSDGYTIENVYKQKSSLKNKQIKVKGVVTKVNEKIMGMNWIHIQDGTGATGEHDLLLTSNETAKVGQTIVAEGTVVMDKDFGAGYSYAVLLENAKISVQ